MRMRSLKYKKFTFPFKHPLKIYNKVFTQKETIILQAVDQNWKNHFGEVSPLPGFCGENLSDCEVELNRILNSDTWENTQLLKEQLTKIVKYPSLMFGIEQILFSVNQNNFINNDEKIIVRNNGLIGIKSLAETINSIEQLVDKGFTTIKLKIGRSNFKDDHEILKTVYEKFGKEVKLRLDNNGSWNLSEAKEYIGELSKLNIEYLEQPVKSTTDLLDLAKTNKISIAADEAIENIDDAIKIINENSIKFLVLKPSIRIGLNDTIQIIDLANERGIKVIISSGFETAIGKNTLLFLTSLVNHDYVHGLNTELLGGEFIKSNIDYLSSPVEFKYSELFEFNKLSI